VAGTKMQKSQDSISRRRMQKLFSNKLAMFGLALTLIITLLCLFAPLLTDSDPNFIEMSLRYEAASPEHPFGCDQSGRDVWARLLYGGRISIAIGLASALCANVLGAVIGCISGYAGGKVDQILMYCSEIFSCFPDKMLILVIMGFAGQGVGVMMLVFIFTGWVGTMRMVRSRILSLKQEVFVESCKAIGIRSTSIMFRHLLPNAMGVFIINITSNVAGYILSEAGLSFLGLGVPKGVATWGNMLNAARNLSTMQNYSMLWILPGIAISLFVLGVNFFGDGLRDVFDVTQE
jgi:peptide/nickel transport system permease protein